MSHIRNSQTSELVLVLSVTWAPPPVGWTTMVPVLPFQVTLTIVPFKTPGYEAAFHQSTDGQAAEASGVNEFGMQPQTCCTVPEAG